MSDILSLIEKFHFLNSDSADLNCPKKLDTLKKLNDTLKQIKTVAQPEADTTAQFLLNELHRTSSKDVIRKLIIRSLNTLTASNQIDLTKVREALENFFLNANTSIGQKLFILNIYLDNLDQFGLDCIDQSKDEILHFLSSTCAQQINQLKTSTAPIAISKLVQNLQLLFKTMIIYLQKCYHSISHQKEQVSTIYTSVTDLLELKSIFNLELGYAACMVQVLLENYESKSIRVVIEQAIKKEILIEDLCFLQAVLTMLKAEQILAENLLDLFEKILVHVLNASSDSTDVGYSIAVSRTVNFWLTKLMDLIELKHSSIEQIFCTDSLWFTKLLNFVWSHFDHSIDVIRNTALNNYRIILQAVKIVQK
ncbi:hypothetical protein BpHYR1_034256, partial [Brachionus plicatilis]